MLVAVHVEPFTLTCPDGGEAEYPGGGVTLNPYGEVPEGTPVKVIAAIVFPGKFKEDSVCPSKVTLQTKLGSVFDNPISSNTTGYVGLMVTVVWP